jgi:hypothetical protein
MKHFIEVTTPAPANLFAITHPWFKYVDSSNTVISRTFARNTPPIQTRAADIRDDYEMTDSLDWLSNGSFKS